jgi:hypothetical protein
MIENLTAVEMRKCIRGCGTAADTDPLRHRTSGRQTIAAHHHHANAEILQTADQRCRIGEMSRSLLNIEKRSLLRLMLSGIGLASKDAV